MSQPISLPKALWRGFTMRCPNCGKGKLFGRYLKVAEQCDVCGEDLTHQRADDFPAYLVIVVVGHITIPAVLIVEEAFAPAIWIQFLFWLPFIALSALALLQPTKGTVVALQWQLGMQGFARAKELRDAAARRPATTTAGHFTGSAANA